MSFPFLYILKLAREFFSSGAYGSAGLVYSWLDLIHETRIYRSNTFLAYKRFNQFNQAENVAQLFDILGIDHVFVLNLKRRLDRKLRTAIEFSKQGIFPEFITAVDGDVSSAVRISYEEHLKISTVRDKWNSHLNDGHIATLKNKLSHGAVAYNFSQRKIFHDSLNNGYRRIAIFDDDVFFSPIAVKIIKNFILHGNKNWKVVALGASDDFIWRKDLNLDSIITMEGNGYYHPLPGKTCGSFAMLYDREIFSELIQASESAHATFDNTALGAVYAKYPKDSYVLFPNAVTASVVDSDIRQSRSQLEHSKRMFWDLSRYRLWSSDIHIYVVSDDYLELKINSNSSFEDTGVYIKYLSNSEADLIRSPADHIVQITHDEFMVDDSIYNALFVSLSKSKLSDQLCNFFLYIC